MKLNNTSTRDKRQIGLLDKWINDFNYIGGFVCGTGFGKSTGVAMRGIKRIIPTSTIFVVPTLKLKDDTEVLFNKAKLDVKTLVINTASKNTNSYECDLLIIDEAHRSVAETFLNIFNTIKYKKLMWLTATVERSDNRHILLLEKAPLIDTVPLKECIVNGWTEPIEIFKVPIQLTKIERNRYLKLNDRFEYIKTELGGGNPLNRAKDMLMYLDRNKWVTSNLTKEVFFVKTISNRFFKKDKNQISTLQKKIIAKGFQINEIGFNKFLAMNFTKPSKEHPIFKSALLAKELYQVIRKRKELLYNAKNKIPKILELTKKHEDQYKFIIGQQIDFLEEVKTLLPEKDTGIYHSKLKKKEKDEFFRRFNDGRTKMKTLISAKSLIEGIDIPKLEIVIVSSFTASKINAIQLRGRIGRLFKDKKPIIYYLYCENSIEETSWLKNILQNEKVTKL